MPLSYCTVAAPLASWRWPDLLGCQRSSCCWIAAWMAGRARVSKPAVRTPMRWT
ncbi:hypothetical protein ACFFX0_29340 [Citricoccus parietis]|uniref:Uncharacterized protein n=1 Tax=Citricoccus parietis TaxID=592307 RepID=A0ABV5G4K4_9MICC